MSLHNLKWSNLGGSSGSVPREIPLIHGTYFYTAFGLKIASDLLLPELLTTSDFTAEPDVVISLGEVPAGIRSPVRQNDIYQAAKNEYLLRIPGVAGYHVTNGDRIIVEPDKQSDLHIVRQFLVGTAYGALLLQRRMMLIHASAVVIDGQCLLFTGESGAGKSTLSAAFRQRGYSILTDDVAVMSVDNSGIVMVQSGYPQQKLSRSSAEALGLDISNDVPVYSGNLKDKFLISAHNGFWRFSVPLLAIYELNIGGARKVSVSSLASVDKVEVLIKNTWCGLIDVLDLNVEHFNYCLDVAGRISVSRLTRPQYGFSMDDQIRAVHEDVQRAMSVNRSSAIGMG